MFKLGLLTLPLPVIALMSCSSGSDTYSANDQTVVNPLEITTQSSNLSRDPSPDVDNSIIEELVAGNNAFALDLYSILATDNKNVFFSPFSISQAIAMAYAGAGGLSEEQMENTLHFTLPPQNLHPAFNFLDLELARRSNPEDNLFDEGCFKLHIANSIWGENSVVFKSGFLDILSVNYGAGMQTLDLSRNPEGARILINGWVSENTENKIVSLLPEGSITPQTALVLVNAVYFKAQWNLPFADSNSYEGDFHLDNGTMTTATYMTQTAPLNYTRGDGFQAVELPYDGGKLSMVILLPESGTIEVFESSLSRDLLASIHTNLLAQEVIASIPKFSYRGESVSLKNTLSELGMADCFNENADFTGMTEFINLRIDDILHKAYITVNEAGTEAAAATTISMYASNPENLLIFKADSPFIYYIRDRITGTILFIGKIIDPNAAKML